MNPKRLTGILLMVAGALFLLAGLLRRAQEPLWLVLGVACTAAGSMVFRSRPPV